MSPSVLHIYKDYYPPVVGGIEMHINQVANGTKDEYDVRVLVANNKPKTEIEKVGDIKVVKAASWGRVASAPLCPSFGYLLKKYSADILHFHCPNPTGDVTYLLRRPKGKVVVTYHSDVVRQSWAMFVYGKFLRKFLSKADVIMPTTPNYVESSKYLQPFAEKCCPVPLGIDVSRFELTPELKARAQERRKIARGKPFLLFVGRLRYYKGLHFLIQALSRIEDAHLVIVGSGPELKNIRKQVKLFKVDNRVTLAGSVGDEDLVSYYHAADVFCLPSHLRSEAYGLVQLEAMACGVPVVSCDLKTGVPYVNQHEKTGLIVPPAAPGKLAEAVNKLIKDITLRHRLGDTAKKRVHEQFDLPVMINKVKQIYSDVLQK